MPTTPKGFPYPTPDDPVSLGANDIRALAEASDALALWLRRDASNIETADTAFANSFVAKNGQVWLGETWDAYISRTAAYTVAANGYLTAAYHITTGAAFMTRNGAGQALEAPTPGAHMGMLGGGAIVVLDSAGRGTIPFGKTVASVLTVTVTGTQAGVPLISPVVASTVTGFTIEAWRPAAGDPALITDTSIAVNWLAIVGL